MNTNKKWCVGSITLIISGLLFFGGMTAIIDPFFHYHKPLKQLQYLIHNERYQNDGIMKHFDYDALITGTSMTENFKTSEFDKIFGVHSVKVPFSGGSYKEINQSLERAVKTNPKLKTVIRGLDYNQFLQDKDHMRYDSYPDYLYDKFLYNDVYYLLNKEIFINNTVQTLTYTKSGGKTTDFDIYANWMRSYTFGKESVDKTYNRRNEKVKEEISFTEADQKLLEENIRQNVTGLAEKNPDITFYLFFTPYSIYHWDSLNQTGQLNRALEAERRVIEQILPYKNIRLFSFLDEFDMITDLNNYKDVAHYGETVNTQILKWMKDGTHELTVDNYREYVKKVEKFYTTYDYDAFAGR